MAKTLLICVGNSITRRGGNSGYVAIITKQLGSEYEVKNFGIDGKTMVKKDRNAYWNTSFFKDLFTLKPDVITLMLGTNDAKSGVWGRYGDDFEADAEAMVDTLLTIKPDLRLLVALPPHIFGSPYGMSDGVLTGIQVPILRSIAKKKGLEIIDVNAQTNSSKYFADGCHPNATGYKVIAEVFYNSITNPVTELKQTQPFAKAVQKNFYSANTKILDLSPRADRKYGNSIIITKESKNDIFRRTIFFLNGRNLSED